ncbi:MAG: TRAP transporter permease [Alphaproteobacteria bacterium]|nr:TRAP transporter permease [Alphaproteobacteria bacterium]MBU0796882.1 TRAP transporter permease [Alphaproteobacteria bacterium]MBU0886922.1 TRAP transporter permease [Alphaproteobacteria bacterium]MBU1813222.1 TRAP transporter permease [Alphaproteobacteria bacterium]
MSEATQGRKGMSDEALKDLVAQSDTGSRSPAGPVGVLLLVTAVSWSIFQLWYASPLPFMFNIFILNDTEARSIHLAFALFLGFMAYPALKRSPRDYIPILDWVLGIAAAICAGYIFIFYRELSGRPGNPTQLDLTVSVIGMILLLEATRRALGPPLMIVAIIFLIYTFAGPYMPDVIAHKGASLQRTMDQQWITTEGVFGIALGVSTSFVFLFVLFGSLLDKAGAGNYFIKVAFALLGHLRGGPAKAAVVASGMTGLISGSSIANVVTTGTFTIPLMKRVGYPGEKAGAVEVAASVNGQIMPPVMGAAAFLMVEYVGISYVDVIKHAFLPAIISYIALLYIVHLEALKLGLKGLDKPNPKSWQQGLLSAGITIASFIILCGAVYYGIGWIKDVFGGASGWIVAVLVTASYIGLVWYSTTVPVLEMDDPNAPLLSLPETAPTVKSGLFFLLPVAVLVWCLMIERLSPGLSAFWATAYMIFILVTQRPLIALFRRTDLMVALRTGAIDLLDGLATGARNMIGIGIATAAAGIIVGTVSLTGIGLIMTEFVEFISAGNLMLMLIFTAVISLILGMGLPTTANYIVVSTLMAPVIVELGAQSGLLVPLIAVHLFVFYFGIMADVTPPVGLASFAAAAISGADPIKTGIVAFYYSMRTAILPFIFIFNTELLLIDIGGPFHLFLTVSAAVIAMLVFAAGTQGFFLVRSRIWESAVLVLVAFTLLRPGFWMDMLYPPYNEIPPTQIQEAVADRPADSSVRMIVEGETLDGTFVNKTVRLPLGPVADGEVRLEHAGLILREEGDKLFVDDVVFGGPAEKAGIDFDWEIKLVEMPAEQPDKQWMFIPALILLGGIVFLQRRRREDGEGQPAAA